MNSKFALLLALSLVTISRAQAQQQPECPVKDEPGYEREVSHYLTQLVKTCDNAIQIGLSCSKGSLSDIIIGDAIQSVCDKEIESIYPTNVHLRALHGCEADCSVKIKGDSPFADSLRSFCVADQKRRFIFMRRRAILLNKQNLCADLPTADEQD